jgi:hypothetical protein
MMDDDMESIKKGKEEGLHHASDALPSPAAEPIGSMDLDMDHKHILVDKVWNKWCLDGNKVYGDLFVNIILFAMMDDDDDGVVV